MTGARADSTRWITTVPESEAGRVGQDGARQHTCTRTRDGGQSAAHSEAERRKTVSAGVSRVGIGPGVTLCHWRDVTTQELTCRNQLARPVCMTADSGGQTVAVCSSSFV